MRDLQPNARDHDVAGTARPRRGAPTGRSRHTAGGLLALQAVAGNSAVARMVAPVVQRDLAAYTREHLEVESSPPSEGPSPTTMTTDTADAPAVQAALQALISAGKVKQRTVRDMLQFSSSGATAAELLAAFSSAGFTKARPMADAVLDEHRISVYSKNEVTFQPGLFWDTTLFESRDNVEVQTKRGLTAAEIAAASSVFGASIAYDRIVLEEDLVMSVGGYVRATPWEINFPNGTLSGGGPSFSFLIHELGHSWQYARGVSLGTTTYHAIFSSYDYGGEARLREVTAAGGGLRAFNTEQQGDIASDAYQVLVGTHTGTRAVYEPYLREFRAGAYR
jgi:hypothetical protein